MAVMMVNVHSIVLHSRHNKKHTKQDISFYNAPSHGFLIPVLGSHTLKQLTVPYLVLLRAIGKHYKRQTFLQRVVFLNKNKHCRPERSGVIDADSTPPNTAAQAEK